MRYLISGASGFVGKHLVKELQGNEVRCLGRCNKWAIKDAINFFQPEVIVHLAAELDDEAKMYESNVELTNTMLEFSKDVPYKAFIYVGSSSEYGYKDHPISERESLEPRTMYEATKAAASMLCQGYARIYDKPIVIARPFSLYGPDDKARKFIPTLIRKFKAKEQIEVAPGVHDWLYIDDFIRGLLTIVDKHNLINPGEVVNFGTGVMATNETVVASLGQNVRVKLRDKMHSYDSEHWSCDTRYAEDKWGWRATTSLAEGLRKCL